MDANFHIISTTKMVTPIDSPTNESLNSSSDDDEPFATRNTTAATLTDVSSMLDAQCRVSRYEGSSGSISTSMSDSAVGASFASLPSRPERKRTLSSTDTPPKRTRSDGSVAAAALSTREQHHSNHQINDPWPPLASYPGDNMLSRGFEYGEPTRTDSRAFASLGERNDSDELFGMSHDEFLSGVEPRQQTEMPNRDSTVTTVPGPDAFASILASSLAPDRPTATNLPTSQSELAATQAPIPRGRAALKDDTTGSGVSSDYSEGSNPSFSPADRIERVYIDESDLTDKDVLCGREFSASDHPGNVEYLKIIAKHKARYNSFGSKHGKKTQIRNLIVDTLVGNGGRFVARSPADRRFYLLAKDEARHKVSQCLREKRNNHSKKKKGKRGKRRR